jgi:hypothetical protein
MAGREKNRGLVYLRRSDLRQELSLPTQLSWALGEAKRLGVSVEGDLNDLKHMQDHGLTALKSLRLDDGVTGGDLSRPGYQAVNDEALRDRTISHLFFYKRDRFARPQESLEAALIEKRLSINGITIVVSGKVIGPLEQGEGEPTDDIALVLEYHQSGQFLRTLGERIIATQRQLAPQGYWIGGRPPLGFVRVLVDSSGNEIEELAPGRRVRQAGCHVRIKPKDQKKIEVWLLILDLKFEKKWGGKRIAHYLNELGVPSPDAGRTRSDHGVPHRVTGKWCANTVLDLCRNPAIMGVLELIRRSEGRYRRHGESGWRSLTDDDRAGDNNRAKMISNPVEVRIKADAGFGALYDEARWLAIQHDLDRRGASQRGIPRARDPQKYPLACRVIDMTDGCGSIMYGRTSGKRALYTCGRYMRTAGTECENNQVDAEALNRLVLSCLRQCAALGMQRTRLTELLKKRVAESAPGRSEGVSAGDELAHLARVRHGLVESRETVGRRMAVEGDDDLCKIMRSEFDSLTAELRSVDQRTDLLKQKEQRPLDPQRDVNAALRILEHLDQVVQHPEAREALRVLVARLGMRVGLKFESAVKGKMRKVRRLVGGLIVFGERELPVPLHGRDRLDPEGTQPLKPQNGHDGGLVIRKAKKSSGTAMIGADPDGSASTAVNQNESHREGVSSTKVSRGDRI